MSFFEQWKKPGKSLSACLPYYLSAYLYDQSIANTIEPLYAEWAYLTEVSQFRVKNAENML